MNDVQVLDWETRAAELRRDGFCVVPGVLDADVLRRLKEAGDDLGEQWTKRAGDFLRAQGSMVSVPQLEDPVFGEVIAAPTVLAIFDRLGLDGAAFTAGYVISKPARSPRLFWHFDWYGWEHERSYDGEPMQLFAMYYLTDTTRENGCLRVIPGSHLRRHAIHDVMTDGHVALSSAEDLSRPEFADWPEERDVPVRAGDVVLGDARLLHAAHANETDDRRSLLTLWYHPHFDALPQPVKATFMTYVQELPSAWPEETRAAVAALHPAYSGGAEPLGRTITGPRA
ncbi:MAG: phytanoyl-CoA dioxygenase family protein [Actinobacteria bacterium]|nr:phytanoyl-CoA dioxygenase family protein [Actinomycetota bacterium]